MRAKQSIENIGGNTGKPTQEEESMKTSGSIEKFGYIRQLMVAVLIGGLFSASWATAATEYFVKPDGDDEADGTSWETALASPQVALDKAKDAGGGTITVTNGTYTIDRGSAGTSQFLALDIDAPIIMQSVEGPQVTIIQNSGSTDRTDLVKISHAEARVEGFTFRGGYRTPVSLGAAGVLISAGTLRNCIIRECYSGNELGGQASGLHLSGDALVEQCIVTACTTGRRTPAVVVAGGTLRNSLVYGNMVKNHYVNRPAVYNAAVAAAVRQSGGAMDHVTIAGNYPGDGNITGLWLLGGTVSNSIIYHNRDNALPMTDARNDQNVYQTGGTISYSLFSPSLGGTGNLNLEPHFVDAANGDYRLAAGSPAINAGDATLGVLVDLNGNPRPQDGNGSGAAAPDMGAFEAQKFDEGALRCDFSATPEIAVGAEDAVFTAFVAGEHTNITEVIWDFGNGQSANGPGPHTVSYDTPGAYSVSLWVTNTLGQGAHLTRPNVVYRAPETVYASETGDNIFPFDTLQKGAPVIQHAIEAAVVTATATSRVNVADGFYIRPQYCPTINVHKGITVQSINGPRDARLSAGSEGRPVELYHVDAVVSGFTITNAVGASLGAGVWIEKGTLENCWILGNSSAHGGGGIAMMDGLVDRCRVIGNHAGTSWNYQGGGGINMQGGTVRNSLIARNSVGYHLATVTAGGGISMRTTGTRVENCTVVDNVINLTADKGGGILRLHDDAVVVNTIVWNNREEESGTPNNLENHGTGVTYANVTHTAAPELDHDPEGTGNLSDIPEPGFVDRPAGDYRLVKNSPCVNVGTTDGLAWITLAGALDLDGNPRLVGGRPELGAYEFIPPRGTLIMFR